MRIEQTRKLLSAGVLPSPAPTEDVDALRERLMALRLCFAAESLGDLLTQAVKTEWNAAAFLDALLRLELERQEERRIAQAIRISHLPTGPTIGNFDFAFQPSVSRSQIETLSTCQWIRDCQGCRRPPPAGRNRGWRRRSRRFARRGTWRIAPGFHGTGRGCFGPAGFGGQRREPA